MNKNILITGGAGFIGSNLVCYLVKKYPQYNIINYDLLTYAGNINNLSDISNLTNYKFIQGDISDLDKVRETLKKYSINGIIHLAAESHVDRSILDPLAFVKTNVLGTATLLTATKEYWNNNFEGKRFYHVSTDEVYGSLQELGFFTETTAYDPRSPYSASKASSDHLVRAWGHTYGLPFVISNCSNNYGPMQFPEKLIPLMILNAIENRPLPVYGNGENIRDWLWVEDHCTAIDKIYHHGKTYETYNIGGQNEYKNIDVVKLICQIIDEKLLRPAGTTAKQITYVNDRLGHDLRYAIDSTKLQNELEWKPSLKFEEGLRQTIDWYLDNSKWVTEVREKLSI